MAWSQAREARTKAWEARSQTRAAQSKIREARSQTRGARWHGRHHYRPRRHIVPRFPVSVIAPPHRVGLERRVAETRVGLRRQLAPSAGEVEQRAASLVPGGLGGPPSRLVCGRNALRKPSEEWCRRRWGSGGGVRFLPRVWPCLNGGRTGRAQPALRLMLARS